LQGIFITRNSLLSLIHRLFKQFAIVLLVVSLLLGCIWVLTEAQAPAAPLEVNFNVGASVTFATHAQLESYGFSWGPSDGEFGALPAGGGTYTFYGTAHSNSGCAGTPNVTGTFTFTGTLDHVSGSNGCARLFGPGDGPSGWLFDRDYAGGGQVLPFDLNGESGWLMPFHAEYHWKNLANPPSFECQVGKTSSEVPCFYGGIGLALSTDGGKSFKVVGQIFQPNQPLSAFEGGGTNMDVGYGYLIVADANGRHVDNPSANPNGVYFYLFFSDRSPGLPGACANYSCMGIARAPYADVIAAALSGDPNKVATVFQKYDGASPNPWTQPATSDKPDLSTGAGKYAPLWSDDAPGEVSVIYDEYLNGYLAVYQSGGGIKVRTSSNLINWSQATGPVYSETGRWLYYPTLIGETGNPTVAGQMPRIYFTSFPTGGYPNYATSVFESVQLKLSNQISSATTTSLSMSTLAPSSQYTSIVQLHAVTIVKLSESMRVHFLVTIIN